MQCPKCACQRIFRDRYAGWKEILRFTPFRPYGCRGCLYRFISWRRQGAFSAKIERSFMRVFLVFSAACPNCHARELERTNRAQLRGTFGRALARVLHFPAFRCAKCGKKFFKFRWHVQYTKALTTPEA